MRHVRLVSFEDDITGNLGLVIKGGEGPGIFADSEGGLIAHDLIEHQNGIKAIGGAADELEAMGGLWQVRGRHGTMFSRYSYHPPAESVGIGDVTIIARDWMNHERRRWYPRIGQYRTHRHIHDDDFMEILDFARSAIKRDLDEDERKQFPLEAYLENALHLMRIGFNKARRRFGDGCAGADTYLAIKSAIAPLAKHVEFAGREFRLSYMLGEARCVEIYPEEEY